MITLDSSKMHRSGKGAEQKGQKAKDIRLYLGICRKPVSIFLTKMQYSQQPNRELEKDGDSIETK